MGLKNARLGFDQIKGRFIVELPSHLLEQIEHGNVCLVLVDRIQHLVPSPDGCDDGVGIGGPGEGAGFCVVLVDEAVDGGLEVDDGVEDAAPEPPLGELGEEAFDGIQPGAGCRHEVEGPAGMAVEPCADLRVLVGGVVVEDGVDVAVGRHRALDGVEEADELLVAMPGHVRPMTVPSSTLSAANSVVVPWRL